MFEITFLGQFRWYRRLLGGRWAQVSGWIRGKRWVKVHPECVERVDEDYTAGISYDGRP